MTCQSRLQVFRVSTTWQNSRSERSNTLNPIFLTQLEAPPADLEEYEALREEYSRQRAMGDIREPYRIPRDYMRATKKLEVARLPEAPLIVFINSRSGGRAGARLTQVLCHALGVAQVSAPTAPGVSQLVAQCAGI